MKSILKTVFVVVWTLVFVQCNKPAGTVVSQNNDSVIGNESEALVNFVEKTSNYVNSDYMPALIGVDDIEGVTGVLVIDIRDTSDYINGHINGAVNKKVSELYNYLLTEVDASAFTKIVIAGYDGMSEGYIVSLFRIIGFGNIYALKYGMSSCSVDLAKNYWLKNISGKFQDKLETKYQVLEGQNAYPKIVTGKNSTFEIAKARVNSLLSDSMDVVVSIDEVVANPEKYVVIAYVDSAVYAIGHIPGAINFETRKSLISTAKLKQLPVDKSLVLYCYSGQTSLQAIAYLRLLGYNAYNIAYGSNAFMYSLMKSNDAIGRWFNPAEHIVNVSLVNGKLPFAEIKTDENNTISETNISEPKKTVPVKKVAKTSKGGGC